MSTRLTNTLIVIIIAATVIAGALVWNRLPDQMASHWNANNEVDGTMPKFWGVFLMPMVSAFMFALFIVIPSIDPLKANVEKFREAFNAFILFIVIFLGYVWKLTILWNMGYTDFNMGQMMLPALGLLFMLSGVLLWKAKRNFFIGIRTPWTLSSDTVWEKTHRLGAILFFFSGVLAMFGAFLSGAIAFLLVLVPLLASSLFLVVYSYVVYRQETKA
jgi:uncharacterized membrane protein